MWEDEAKTLYIAQSPLSEILPLVSRLEYMPPLHFLIMHFWIRLFPDPVFAMRFFSILCGLATMAAFWVFARRVLGAAPPLALALACLSSFWIDIAQTGRTYALYLLLVVVGAFLLHRLRESWRASLAFIYVSTSLMGLYCHPYFLFFLTANVFYLALRVRARTEIPRWATVYGVIALLYIPYVSLLLIQTRSYPLVASSTGTLTFGELAHIVGMMVFDVSVLDIVIADWTRVLGFALIAALAAGALLNRQSTGREKDATLFCWLHLAVPLAAGKALELVLRRTATQPRYLAPVSPFLYLLLALAFARLRGAGGALARAALAVVLAAGLAGYYAAGVYVDPRLAELSEAIKSHASPRDIIVHLHPYYYIPMRFYYLRERPNFMVEQDQLRYNWDALPGYGAVIPTGRLERMGRCLIIDPERSLFPYRFGASDGRGLAEWLRSR